jgi:S1-C subfamily serine protease
MTRNAVAIMVLSISCYGVASGQDRRIPYADAVTFLGMENVAQIVKQAVFAVQVQGNQGNKDPKDDWVPIGSGFLVRGQKDVILGVTCHHVVSVGAKAKKTLYIGLDTEKGYNRFQCQIAYADPNTDIAVVTVRKRPNEDVTLLQKLFSEELFDDGSSLVEGRGVIIPGYPLALGIEDDENHPIIRFGFVAQFAGKNTFLLDGFASHGNSGSPVFAIKHDHHRLIGMVTSHINDSITLLDESGRITAQLPYNSGLARGVTMKSIAAAIEKADQHLAQPAMKDRGNR